MNDLPTRRDALKAAASIGLAAASADAIAQQSASEPQSRAAPSFYYVDGYHGGVDGHMPRTSLKNVLDGLDHYPGWKVSFEIEPYSWAVFAKSDPQSIERLRKFLDDDTPAARVELVSAAYGQTYAWNINGESNIRQLIYGREEIHAVFPKVRVDTYAVQEPCWTSCLPQLLKSLGYKRAVLPNSTCWGGYHAPTLDADLMNWIGPDGSSIPTVPRYASDKLVGPATEENARPTAEFIERCLAAGVAHPAGTILQDMGWAGRPWGMEIPHEIFLAMKHVTWREYAETIATPASKDWHASQEDMRGALAWGATILQRIAQIVRASENQILQAEKMASMAKLLSGAAFPIDDLKQAWKYLLKSQHHDVWIVPYNRRPGGTWASEADERRTIIDQTCKKIIQNSSEAMIAKSTVSASDAKLVRLFNTTGFQRKDAALIDVAEVASQNLIAEDSQGQKLPCQLLAADEKSGTSKLMVLADAPAMGFTTIRLNSSAPADRDQRASSVSATVKPDGGAVLETDLYSLSINPQKGGTISRLFAKDIGREFVDSSSQRSFTELRGFFPEEKKWLSSADSPAKVTITEKGPVRLAARIEGNIGQYPFTTDLSLVSGQRRIDLRTTLHFPVDGLPFAGNNARKRFRVGEPWERGRDATRSNRRPFYDSSYKLQALFPLALDRPKLYKNAAFDVCQSKLQNTSFNSWETIKHNVIVNWVDVAAGDDSAGLAVLSDHTTAYSFGGNEPLGLVMCYAGVGNWFDYTLGREPSISYALVPHAGNWAKARLWRELTRWSEPLVAHGTEQSADSRWSLVDATNSGLEVTTIFEHGGHTLIRLFNAEGDDSPQRLALATQINKVEMVELDGRVISELPIERSGSGQTAVTISMPRFGVRTLRVSTIEKK